MPSQEKVQAVAELTELFEGADSFFVTDYQGLNVEDMTALRRNFRQNDVKYLIAKNTLLRLAVGNAGIDGVEEHLSGPTAIAFSTGDPAAAAKVIHESYKDKELPRVRVFHVDGTLFGADDLKRLADLPSREVLLQQVVGAVEAPLTSLVGNLDGFFTQLIGSIEALAEKRRSE